MAVDKYEAAGSFTWTCPAGVTSVDVVAIGGGGGGSGQSSGGGAGGDSTFDGATVTAKGGAAGSTGTGGSGGSGGTGYSGGNGTSGAGGAGGGAAGGSGNGSGSTGGSGTPSGGNGGAFQSFGAGNAGAAPGGGGGASSGSTTGGGGGGGSRNRTGIAVTPLTGYTVVVGAGGSAGTGGKPEQYGAAGQPGTVWITYTASADTSPHTSRGARKTWQRGVEIARYIIGALAAAPASLAHA